MNSDFVFSFYARLSKTGCVQSSSFSWRLFLLLLPLGLTSAFGQAGIQLVCDSVSASKSKCYVLPCEVQAEPLEPWANYL